MTTNKILNKVDHTLLSQTATWEDTVDKPIKELIIKDSKTDLTVNYVTSGV